MPGVCPFFTSANLSEGDWEIFSGQIRKYAVRNDVRYVLIQGDTYLIYLHLEDPESIAATENYTLLLPELRDRNIQ